MGLSGPIIFISPPARWGLLDFIRAVLLILLLLLLPLLPLPSSASSSSSFSSTMSASNSTSTSATLMSTSALPTLRQSLSQLLCAVALLDLNCRLPIWVGTAGPQPPGSELSGHRWTSTRDLQSSISTAGPQPGTFRAQWALLDLNLGPSKLSGHRWTSTAR